MTADAAILRELRRINARLDAMERAPATDPIVTRTEAARMLKVSISQLYRLIAAGKLVTLPSGIARAELERYCRTPQQKLRTGQRIQPPRSAKAEADRTRALLKSLRRRNAT